MTPEQARRRARRRIRRRRRRVIIRALLILPAILAAAVLTADVVEVSKEPSVVAPLSSPRVSRTSPRPSRLRVPVPVFRPSILLSALELEIPELEPLDLELVDREVKRSLERRRIAWADKQPKPPKQPEPVEEEAKDRVRADLIQVSAVAPHLLELIPPRPFVDPSDEVGIPDFLPSPDPWWPLGWPGVGWIDFPLDPGGGLKLVTPLPGAKEKEEDEEEEEPPPIIPEPGTGTLLVLGLALLGIARRRPAGGRAG